MPRVSQVEKNLVAEDATSSGTSSVPANARDVFGRDAASVWSTEPVNTQRPLDLARDYIDRYNAGDLEGLLALLSADVEFQSATDPIRTGLDEVRAFYEPQLAAGFRAAVLRGIDDDDEITYFEVRVTVPVGDDDHVSVECAVRQRWVDDRLVEYRNFQNAPSGRGTR